MKNFITTSLLNFIFPISLHSEKHLKNYGENFRRSLLIALKSAKRPTTSFLEHPFHLVEPSSLPIFMSILLALNVGYFICTVHFINGSGVSLRIFLFFLLLININF
jgi:hypothetical protein